MSKTSLRSLAALGTSLIILAMGCDQSPQNRNTNTSNSHNQNSKQDQGIKSEHFPISKGNKWVYKKKVSPDSSGVQYFVNLFPADGNYFPGGAVMKMSSGIREPQDLQPESREEYLITEMNPDGSWNVKITGNYPRDGRYTHPFEFRSSNKNLSAKSVSQTRWQLRGDGIVKELTSGKDDEGIRMVAMKYAAKLTPNEITSPDYAPNEAAYAPMWHVGSRLIKDKVVVPSGSFEDILECVTMMNVTNPEDVLYQRNAPQFKKALFKDGDIEKFVTRSQYARGVGLVREVQFNRQNKITYTMELESFNVK